MRLVDAATALIGAAMDSAWFLPVLAMLIAIDGPLPMLPTETLLLAALTRAVVSADLVAVALLFAAAVLGSLVGDLLIYSLGRGSGRLLPASTHGGGRTGEWVRRKLARHPVAICMVARMMPGGRLFSVAACGRARLSRRVFLTAVAAAATVWSIYMLVLAAALGPITAGDPLLSLVAGTTVGLLIAAIFALARSGVGR